MLLKASAVARVDERLGDDVEGVVDVLEIDEIDENVEKHKMAEMLRNTSYCCCCCDGSNTSCCCCCCDGSEASMAR